MKTTISEHLRIIKAIVSKDLVEAVKNKITLSILLGTAIMVLSSQALPLLLNINPTPTAIYYDQGKSVIVKSMVRNQDYVLRPRRTSEDLETSLGGSATAMLGLEIPSDFDQLSEAGTPILLTGYTVHWMNPEETGELVNLFEEELSSSAGVQVEIKTDGNLVYPTVDGIGYSGMIAVGFVIAIVTIGSSLVPYLLVDEKVSHTINAILVSPASITHIIIAKALVGLVYCLVSAVVVGTIGFKYIIQWDLFILASLCGGLLASALGLVIGVFADNPNSIGMWIGAIVILFMFPAFLERYSSPEGFLQTIFPWMPSVALSYLIRASLTSQAILRDILRNLSTMLVSFLALFGLVYLRARKLTRQ